MLFCYEEYDVQDSPYDSVRCLCSSGRKRAFGTTEEVFRDCVSQKFTRKEEEMNLMVVFGWWCEGHDVICMFIFNFECIFMLARFLLFVFLRNTPALLFLLEKYNGQAHTSPKALCCV